MRIAVAFFLVLAGAAFAQEPTPVGAVFNDCTDCPDMVVIPAGNGVMGADADDMAMITPEQAALELPRHKVTFHSFAMGRTPVTRAQFSAFTFETGYKIVGICRSYNLKTNEVEEHPGTSWIDPGFVQTDRDPVVCVNAEDAKAYVAWLTRKTRRPYRLPSEAEWEYAARAGTASVRFWGEAEACQFANVADRTAVAAGISPDKAFPCTDGHATTAPVGRFAPNAFGLADMLGNVAQWTADCLHPTYDGAPADGSAWTGEAGCRRVFRGGNWFAQPLAIRAAGRRPNNADARVNGLGFRVARDIDPPPEAR